MNIVIGNWGNESIALMNWCIKNSLPDVYFLTVNTGWQSTAWQVRVKEGMLFAKTHHIKVITLNPTFSFSEIVKHRKEFPTPSFLWCADTLKKVPILNWLENNDLRGEAKILLPYVEALSQKKYLAFQQDLASEQYDDREIECPLYALTEEECRQLVSDTGLAWLTHRSQECAPCVNSSRQELKQLDQESLTKLAELEHNIGNTLCKNSQGMPITIMEYLDSTTDDSISGFELNCSDYFGCGK